MHSFSLFKKAPRNFTLISLYILLISLIFQGCVSEEEYNQAKEEVKKLDKEVTEQIETISKLEIQINSLQNNLKTVRENAQNDLNAASENAQKSIPVSNENAITPLKTTIQSLKDQLAQNQNSTNLLQQEKESLENQLLSRDKKIEEINQSRLEMKQGQQVLAQLIDSLKKEIESNQIKISRFSNRIVVRLQDKILFDLGNAELRDTGIDLLDIIGNSLKMVKNRSIQIEGHTDYQKIRGEEIKEKFPTNLDLSIARATSVAHYLINNVGIRAYRISVAGYGPHQPLENKWTPEVLQKNRRVEIVLFVPENIRIKQ